VPLHTAVAMVELGYEGYMAAHIRDTFFTPEFAAEHPERVAWLVRAFWERRPTLESYLRHVIARQEHQTADRLAEIALPTLVLIGDRDRHVGGTGVHWEQSEHLLTHIPGARRRVVEGGSHGYLWQMPQETARLLLEWTAELDG
jgi:pimeloyl-ACP methyl ester carboxylesterase